MRSPHLALMCAGALLWSSAATAQQLFIYPQKGQDAAQQQKDQAECQNWATQQTGFNPLAPPGPSSPPPQQEATQGGAVRGAARGAAVGAAIGAIGGNAGKGAAMGAAGGGLMGGMRRSDQRRRQDQERENWERQQAAQQQQARDSFNRAFRTCLEGRGYTVN